MPPKISILSMFSKDLLNSSIFERFDILKIVKTNINKNRDGMRVIVEILFDKNVPLFFPKPEAADLSIWLSRFILK